MFFKIEIPEKNFIKFIEIENGQNVYKKAVDEFEQILWDENILPDDDNLTPENVDTEGASTLELSLKKKGFLNYGEGENLPCISLRQEWEKAFCLRVLGSSPLNRY